MTRWNIAIRLWVIALFLAGALAAASCVNGAGIGAGMDYPARWGGGGSGSTGPPIFVGGPSA